MAMAFVPGIAKTLTSNLLGSSSSQENSKQTNAAANTTTQYDIQTASKRAGEELIKQICKTLNSPQNKLFAHVVENSFKSYFSEKNAAIFNSTMTNLMNQILREISKPIFQNNTLNKHLLVHFVKKHREVLKPWILQSI